MNDASSGQGRGLTSSSTVVIPAWIPWTTFWVISAGSTKLGSRPYESLLIYLPNISTDASRAKKKKIEQITHSCSNLVETPQNQMSEYENIFQRSALILEDIKRHTLSKATVNTVSAALGGMRQWLPLTRLLAPIALVDPHHHTGKR